MCNVNKRKIGIKSIGSILMGTFLEYYDYMLYMYFLFMLTPLFFPHENYVVMQLMGMASFAISFCMRPLGAVVFGYIGDRYGRKKSMLLSTLLMSFPTLIISLLPTYQCIGLYAPIILICCRLIQGVSVGGEASGANVLLFESAQESYKSTISSLLNVACWSGGLIGSLLGFLFLHFKSDWAWRLPFLLGSMIGLFGYYIRKNICETIEFNSSTNLNSLIEREKSIFHYWKNILSIVGISSGATIPMYIIFVFLNQLYKNVNQLDEKQILLHNTIITIFIIIMQLVFGYLGDKFSGRNIIKLSSISLVIVSYPLFLYVFSFTTYWKILMCQIILAFLYSGISGPVCAYLVTLFPNLQRCKGVGISWSVGIAICSIVPSLAVILVEITGRPQLVSIFIILGGLLSWAGINMTSRDSSKEYPENDKEPELLLVRN